MREANTKTTTLQPRFVRALRPVQVTLRQPGKTTRSPCRVITGRLLGVMRWPSGGVHHYRVAGDDGVCYLAPPHWLASESKRDAEQALRKASNMDLVRQLAAMLDVAEFKQPGSEVPA